MRAITVAAAHDHDVGQAAGLDGQVRRGWEEIAALLEGRPPPPRQLSWVALEDGGAGAESAGPCWRAVDVRAVRVERVREFGEVYLALALWRRLGLHECLAGLLAAGGEAVPWATVACILKAARFCGQLSELGVAERWYRRTALEDLLGVRWAQINDDRLYRGLDALHAHTEKLCAHLLARYQSWFGVRFDETPAEAALRTSKSDLHLRPVFHRKDERVAAHLLVCFLALALWRALEMWMQGKGLGTCARQLVGKIATIGGRPLTARLEFNPRWALQDRSRDRNQSSAAVPPPRSTQGRGPVGESDARTASPRERVRWKRETWGFLFSG